MPRKYTKKKGIKNIKRGGTLTKTLSDGENIMNDEIIILKNRLDELEMKLEICCRDMVQGANTIQRVYRGHQGRNTFKQTRRTMKPNVTDALLDLPQDVGDLITSQVTKYKKGMTYDEFVQYLQNKGLYNCFNMISLSALTSETVRLIWKNSNSFDSYYECGSRLDDLSEHNRTVSIIFTWYQATEAQVININDLDRIFKLDNERPGVFTQEEATRLSKEYHKNLPEYREENLREAYQYYIEQWNKLYF